MSTIAIIEDNQNIQIELSNFFQEHKYETVWVDCHDPMVQLEPLLLNQQIQAILLDINLYELDGFEICKKIRRKSQVPILFVTCREDDLDEIKALQIGGDDFIRKPYRLPVLLAKVERMVERSQISSNCMYAGDVYLDVAKGQIVTKEDSIELSKNELKILYCLFHNQDQIISKDKLIEYLWENKLYVDENILNVNLSRMRKRLGEIGLSEFIRTVPKQGYTLKINSR
ncbi:MAG: response regulator transcription factor [Clostridiales bacterium]|nr:response regulator transcription factor [Clostridiales bacterium]